MICLRLKIDLSFVCIEKPIFVDEVSVDAFILKIYVDTFSTVNEGEIWF